MMKHCSESEKTGLNKEDSPPPVEVTPSVKPVTKGMKKQDKSREITDITDDAIPPAEEI
ncbi:MAG: hypothetical protein HC887_03355 [Desulfobacteraceae bacterium]|nr:hypothetical protein [Desulfobacteraceae bacterium]